VYFSLTGSSSHSPGAARTGIDVEQSATVVLVSADATVGAQVGRNGAHVTEDAEIDSIAAEVMGVLGTAGAAVADSAAAC